MPSSYEDIVLFTKTLEEILADKLEAFACSTHIRYRDIWDMQWLMRRPTIDLEEACVLRMRKEIDYNETKAFANGVLRLRKELPQIIEGEEFTRQMKRFLPLDQFDRTIGRAPFRAALIENMRELYERCTASF
ncbi:nucleotidyl transferase AbiEii/AbiGii toxin family protein [Gordonibacter sp.]|uniref:nucleotidyl transferase AbiEii/AbiGii toxin family protein n=1 Tax=Gordonibacter sp. TaxID=1968902 RepID=UPI002FC6CCD1